VMIVKKILNMYQGILWPMGVLHLPDKYPIIGVTTATVIWPAKAIPVGITSSKTFL